MADTDIPAPSCPACSPDQASDATPEAEIQAMLAHHPGRARRYEALVAEGLGL